MRLCDVRRYGVLALAHGLPCCVPDGHVFAGGVSVAGRFAHTRQCQRLPDVSSLQCDRLHKQGTHHKGSHKGTHCFNHQGTHHEGAHRSAHHIDA